MVSPLKWVEVKTLSLLLFGGGHQFEDPTYLGYQFLLYQISLINYNWKKKILPIGVSRVQYFPH
jgi:hypothetical protein